MKKIINLKARRIGLVEVNALEKRIEKLKNIDMNKYQRECYNALIINFNDGNYKKAKDILSMLEASLNGMDICKEVLRNFKIIK